MVKLTTFCRVILKMGVRIEHFSSGCNWSFISFCELRK